MWWSMNETSERILQPSQNLLPYHKPFFVLSSFLEHAAKLFRMNENKIFVKSASDIIVFNPVINEWEGTKRRPNIIQTKEFLPLSLSLLFSWDSCCRERCSHAPAIAHMAQGPVDYTKWTDELELAWYYTGLSSTVEWKLWTLTASSPAESPQLHLFQDWFKGICNLRDVTPCK